MMTEQTDTAWQCNVERAWEWKEPHSSAFRTEVVDMHDEVLGRQLHLILWDHLHSERHGRVPADVI